MIITQVHRIILITIIILLPKVAFTQNLISNGGLENYSSLPTGYGQYFKAIGWSNVNGSIAGYPAAENKVYKYLIYAFGEIVLVVIGIFLALQLKNWNEERKVRGNETVLLSELRLDF